MNTVNKYEIERKILMLLISSGFCFASTIRNDELSFFSVPIIGIYIFLAFVYLTLFAANRVTALHYELVVLTNLVGIASIFLVTAYRLSEFSGFLEPYVFFMIGFAALLGLGLQIPYYSRALITSRDTLEETGKLDITNKRWVISKKTEYQIGKFEKGLVSGMHRLSFLSYLAPAAGMLTGRLVSGGGYYSVFTILFLYFFVILFLGLGVQIGALLLIFHLKKTENITLLAV